MEKELKAMPADDKRRARAREDLAVARRLLGRLAGLGALASPDLERTQRRHDLICQAQPRYATLVPGVDEPGVGPLRDAARPLIEHDQRVAARTGHFTCAGHTHAEDFELDIHFCPCGHEPVVGAARP